MRSLQSWYTLINNNYDIQCIYKINVCTCICIGGYIVLGGIIYS